MLEKTFKLKEHGTDVKTEVLAGITTFFTMAYIVMVNPQLLSITGMDEGAVFVATVLSAVIATLIMAFYANVPYAQAAGMGLNAFFTFSVVIGAGFTWRQALSMVFICGIFNMIITFTNIRKLLIAAIPESLQKAIGGGIGLFIAYMGFKNAGFFKFTIDPGTYIVLSPEDAAAAGSTIIADGSLIPGLTTFNNIVPLLALFGLILTIVLLIKKVNGAIFIGIIATTVVAIIVDKALHIPVAGLTLPEKWFDLASIGNLKHTFGQIFTKEGLPSLFTGGFANIIVVLLTAFSFSLSDTFDTIGTFIGTGRASGIFSEKEMEDFAKSKKIETRLDKALVADSIATSAGAILGTSNVTTYVESAAGIAVGGRTGLTALVIAILFLLCLPFAGIFTAIPMFAIAPALIIVGVLMMASIVDIKWNDLEEAVPAFFTLVMMPFAYSITQGVAFGFILYCVIKLASGKRKEIHPIMAIATGLFILEMIINGLKSAGII